MVRLVRRFIPTPIRWVVRLVVVVAVAAGALAATAVALVPAVQELSDASLPVEERTIDLSTLERRSFVYDKNGTPLATFRAEIDREPVPLDRVPDHLVGAVLAVEDADFYSHDGVNLRSILRALVANVDEGEIAQGGSTITQQLVKLETSNEQTIERKIKEAVLARRLEETMTKEEILERYLNSVYFGHGAYGVQAAAETYFNLPNVEDVNEVQSAMLAGLIANPSQFDPITAPGPAERRRSIALERMVAEDVITEDQRLFFEEVPIPAELHQVYKAPKDYFVEDVKRVLLARDWLADDPDQRRELLFGGGLRIYTTLDPVAQYNAQFARNSVLSEIAPENPIGTIPLDPNPITGEPRIGTSAMVSVEPSTGAVRAMVGGPGFDVFQYNIATQAVRQTGSSFKTFVLLAALEDGISPLSSVSGVGPCSFNFPGYTDTYDVENFGGSRGAVDDIRSQTLRSSNCAYVRLAHIVGLDKVVDVARRLGVSAAFDTSIRSMPLGSIEVRPIEMAAAYAAIANDGTFNPPYLIDRVEDAEGNVLYEHQSTPYPSVSPEAARMAADILEDNVQYGTGTRAAIEGQHAAGKTGTAQGSGDAWFVGFTPYLSTAVWMGSPDDRYDVIVDGTSITGGSYPAEIWGRFMAAYHTGLAELSYIAPEPPGKAEYLFLDKEIDSAAGRDPDDPFASLLTPPTTAPPPTLPPTTLATTTTSSTSTTAPPQTTTTFDISWATSTTTTAPPTTTTTAAPTTTTEERVPGMPGDG